jgi:hypothetical protein
MGDIDWKFSLVVEAFGGGDSGSGGGDEETNDATHSIRSSTKFLEQYLDVNYVLYNQGL